MSDAIYRYGNGGAVRHEVTQGDYDSLVAKLAATEALLLKGSHLWQMSQMRGNHRSCSCATCVALDGWAQEAERDKSAEPAGPSIDETFCEITDEARAAARQLYMLVNHELYEVEDLCKLHPWLAAATEPAKPKNHEESVIGSCYVCRDSNSVEFIVDNTASAYSEWIPGEGADIYLLRCQETKRVVGCRLPFYGGKFMFSDEPQPSEVDTEPILKWVATNHDVLGHESEWQLMVGGTRAAAIVWANGTWHTWDRDGVGGENSVEETVRQAKIEAAAAAIEQGFI